MLLIVYDLQNALLSTGCRKHSDAAHEIRLICAKNYSRLQTALPGAAPLEAMHFYSIG